MRVLLVIPSRLKQGVDADVAAGVHPTMDYYALAAELQGRGADVDFLEQRDIESSKLPADLALALAAAGRKGDYDAIFTNSESISLPLALLLGRGSRPRHVTIGHRVSTPKKRFFFTVLQAHRHIDRIFVYAASQADFAVNTLGVPAETVWLIPFHADADFFHPMPETPALASQVCAVGLEWRDYPTLIEAARSLPDIDFRLAAASPWSKHKNETEDRTLPPNVAARRYEYGELRTLYAQSFCVAVPLYDNDFQAGVTTILEGMAMGKPVIATATTGQKDVILDGETGLYVPPGDPSAWIDAMRRLFSDPALREKLGRNGRAWLVENASLKKWASTIADALIPAS